MVEQSQPPKDWSAAEIRAWVDAQGLAYQQVELPFGIKTAGDSRLEAREIIFARDMTGKSFIDFGSYLGLFCLEALKAGASRAVGFELDKEKVSQARVIAEMRQLHPTYVRKNCEAVAIEGMFDYSLLLNVLHHTFDPVSLVRKVARATSDTMFLEVARNGPKYTPSSLERFRTFLGRSRADSDRAAIFAADYVAGAQNQTFFFSEKALRIILSQHMALFHEVKVHKTKYKSRLFLECKRLQIGHLFVVAGVTSAGKSIVCDRLREGSLKSPFGIDHQTPVVSPTKLSSNSVKACFPERATATALLNYDMLSVIERRNAFSFERDVTLDLTDAAKEITVLLIAPPKELLIQQLLDAESNSNGHLSSWHKHCLARYQELQFLKGIYIDFVMHLSERHPLARFHVLTGEANDFAMNPDGDGLGPSQTASEAIQAVTMIYDDKIDSPA